ncbi:hypothetical protein AAFF_G00131770 [Aldrovandia affinis]|uniref:Uncharacterized protein n=1 Tax=Aldrovandia affinis TaxID=143900 RepID=A0AAD7RR07_9TELE|nr:hypothetical protein AAFF_G00131770 [Aldrovandia affinis]
MAIAKCKQNSLVRTRLSNKQAPFQTIDQGVKRSPSEAAGELRCLKIIPDEVFISANTVNGRLFRPLAVLDSAAERSAALVPFPRCALWGRSIGGPEGWPHEEVFSCKPG